MKKLILILITSFTLFACSRSGERVKQEEDTSPGLMKAKLRVIVAPSTVTAESGDILIKKIDPLYNLNEIVTFPNGIKARVLEFENFFDYQFMLFQDSVFLKRYDDSEQFLHIKQLDSFLLTIER